MGKEGGPVWLLLLKKGEIGNRLFSLKDQCSPSDRVYLTYSHYSAWWKSSCYVFVIVYFLFSLFPPPPLFSPLFFFFCLPIDFSVFLLWLIQLCWSVCCINVFPFFLAPFFPLKEQGRGMDFCWRCISRCSLQAPLWCVNS